MKKVRLGIIGCGTVACYGHIPAIIQTPGAELIAISDLNTARLDELQKQHSIEATYTDYRDLLARDDIDAVGVATPVGFHHPFVMDAARAGKHVFCEKPIADNPAHAKEMVAAMQDAGKLLAVNFENRHTDPHPEMKALLDQGTIGDLKVLRFVVNWMGGRWASEERYQMLMTEGMGPIVDCGVHDFDLARWFSGSEFAEIAAKGVNIEDYPNPDHVIATCKMENGVIVLIEGGWAYTHNTSDHSCFIHTELVGTNGLVGYIHWQTSSKKDELQRELYVYSKDNCYRKPVTSAEKSFDRMYSLFVQSVQAGNLIDLPSGHDGLKALEAALTALTSAQNR